MLQRGSLVRRIRDARIPGGRTFPVLRREATGAFAEGSVLARVRVGPGRGAGEGLRPRGRHIDFGQRSPEAPGMRVAWSNVENLFQRAKALKSSTDAASNYAVTYADLTF